MFHIALWVLLFGALLAYVAIRMAPDRRARPILNEDGWPNTFPRNDDQATMYQARRGKVK